MRITCVVASLFVFATLEPAPARAAATSVGCSVAELINALHTANVSVEPDTLELAADCTYTLAAVDNMDAPPIGATGLPVITSDIMIHGNHATIERSSASGTPPFRLFRITSPGQLTLDQITLQGGDPSTAAPDGHSNHGGAILNDHGRVEIANSVLQRNGVASDDFGGSGGTIYNNAGNVIITGSVLQDGGAAGAGSILNSKGAILTMTNSQVRNFEVWYSGGAITNLGLAEITSTVFEKNFAGDDVEIAYDELWGGAIDNWDTLIVRDSTFRNNYAFEGGAVGNRGSLTIVNSSFSDNLAGYSFPGLRGGGIANRGNLTLVNSTLTKNKASKGGGLFHCCGLLIAFNVTLAKNEAVLEGGNLFVDDSFTGKVDIANTVFVKGKPQNCAGTVQGRGGNLRSPRTDPSCSGRYGNPMLGKFRNNGGPTNTMALKPGSAAIDAGSELVCADLLVYNLDQRGVFRPLDGNGNGAATCDIGAYEAPAQPPAACPPTLPAPTLVMPLDRARVSSKRVRLDWDEAQCAESYRVVVREDSPTGQLAHRKHIPVTESMTNILKRNQAYVWKVQACDATGCGRGTEWQSFLVGD